MKKHITIKHIKHSVILLAFMTLASVEAKASFWTDLGCSAHIGYCLGGAMPASMPAEIRSLESYKLRPNFQIGAKVEGKFTEHWGITAGLDMETKAMKIDASVKNYHVKIVRGGETQEGQFTGTNYTEESQFMLTLPVTGAYYVKNVCLYAGIYGSCILESTFKGYAYNGYLRNREPGMEKGDPTGTKILLGESPKERGEYDFSDDMGHWEVGVLAGVDWYFAKRWGVYANVTYGFLGIHKNSFDVLDQKLHPFYGTIGLTFKLK